jgi:hypothetical protein
MVRNIVGTLVDVGAACAGIFRNYLRRDRASGATARRVNILGEVKY